MLERKRWIKYLLPASHRHSLLSTQWAAVYHQAAKNLIGLIKVMLPCLDVQSCDKRRGNKSLKNADKLEILSALNIVGLQ